MSDGSHSSRPKNSTTRSAAICALLGVLLVMAAVGPAQAATGTAGAAARVTFELRVVPLTTTEAYLAWTPPKLAQPPITYSVIRDGRTIATLPAWQRAYLDESVAPSTVYVYRVQVDQPPGQPPIQSPPVRITSPALPETPDTTPPTGPELLDVQPGDGRMVIAWSDGNDDTDISAYILSRDGAPIAIVSSGTSMYFDTDIEPGRAYDYSIEAVDVVGHRSKPERGARATAGPASSPPPKSAVTPARGRVAGISTGWDGALVSAVTTVGHAPQLRRYPYLTDVVGPNATINFATDRSASTASVKWGRAGVESCQANTASATRTSMTVNSVSEYQWKANLTLGSGTQYCYRIYLGATDLLGSDPSPTFFTQVPAGSPEQFSFAVIGDWGSVDDTGANPQQANLMAQLATSGARFALTTGDNAYPSGSQSNYGDLVQTGASISAVFGLQYWARVGATMPLFPAIGNHGFNRSDTVHPHFLNWPQDRAVESSGGRYQKDYYCCVNSTSGANYPSAWYAFDAGNARFYVLQTAWPDSNSGTGSTYANDYAAQWTPSSRQYQWLANDLANNPRSLRFAFFHYPPYSDNKHESSDTYLQGAGNLEGLLAQHGVDLVFNGHAHVYQRNARLEPPLVPTYLTGGGGARLQPLDAGCSPHNAYGLGWSYSANNGQGKGYACGGAPIPASTDEIFHFLLVTVDGSTVRVKSIDSRGTPFDEQSFNFGGAGPDPTSTPTVPEPTPTLPAPAPTPQPTATLPEPAPTQPAPAPTPTATAPQPTPTLPEATATVPEPTPTSTATPEPTPTATLAAENTPAATANPTLPPSATPTATVTSAPAVTQVFRDDFESGTLSAWTTAVGLTAQSDVVRAGAYAARGSSPTGTAYAKKTLGSEYTEGYLRMYFNVVAPSGQVNLLRLRTAGDRALVYLGITSVGRLQMKNDVSGSTVTSATSVSPGWHSLELRALIGGPASLTEVWLDGQRISDLSLATDLGTAPIGRVQMGDTSTTRQSDVAFDDVVFDINPIGR